MEIFCPHCGQRFQVANQVEGESISCQSCNGTFSIPKIPSEPPVAIVAGSQQSPGTQGGGLLITLCVLAILFSSFGIIRGLLYESVASLATDSGYWRGSAFAILNVTTLVGAIMMMNRKFSGLIVYSAGQGLNLLLTFYTMAIYSESIGAFAMFIGAFFYIPEILFLILFWLPAVRRNFTRSIS